MTSKKRDDDSSYGEDHDILTEVSELDVQLKLNIESSVGGSTPTEAEPGAPLPLIEVGVSRLDSQL